LGDAAKAAQPAHGVYAEFSPIHLSIRATAVRNYGERRIDLPLEEDSR